MLSRTLSVPWESLPAAMQVRYGLRPFSGDTATVKGTLQIELSRAARILSPLLRLGGAFVPYGGECVPVTVRLYTGAHTDILHFDRFFHFPGRPVCRFHSQLVAGRRGEIIELIRFGLGWRARCVVEGSRMELRHAGYVLRMGKKSFRLPLEWVAGRCTAIEEALTRDSYRMWMHVHHPILGPLQRYGGVFRVTEVVHA